MNTGFKLQPVESNWTRLAQSPVVEQQVRTALHSNAIQPFYERIGLPDALQEDLVPFGRNVCLACMGNHTGDAGQQRLRRIRYADAPGNVGANK